MTGTYVLRKGVSTMSDLLDGRAGLGLGIGNVYYVVKSTEAFYGDILATYAQDYIDGSTAVHTSIESALAATVECRNDYVVVWPSDSDYDIDTAALVMDKKSVHLICPSGFGYDRGANNSVRIEQTTDSIPIIAVSDSSVEIAGFYFKPYYGQSHITLAATSYSPNIHHNTFVLKWESGGANLPAIKGTGDAGAWGGIERNWFVSQSGNDQTCPKIIEIASPATAARVCYNDFMLGDGNIATVGIYNGATKGEVSYNNFGQAADDATWTVCVQIGGWGTAIGNRAAASDGAVVTGGVDEKSFVDNMSAVAGGTIDED